MPGNVKSHKISVTSLPSNEQTFHLDPSRRASVSHRVSFDERLLDDILALRNSYNYRTNRRPTRVSLKSIPTSYLASGKVNVKSSHGTDSKRSNGSRISDVVPPECKRMSYVSRPSTTDREVLSRLSLYDPENTGEYWIRKKKLRLPPVILPPIHTIKPRNLESLEEILGQPRQIQGQITDGVWSELQECRYLRPGLRKYRPDIKPRQSLV